MNQQELIQNFVTELRRGSLTLGVLGCLKKPHYGYALLETLQAKQIEIEANTLYPLLRRLETQGLLDSTWDTSESRPRKYYTINLKGEEVYKELVAQWRQTQSHIEAIIKEENNHD